MLSVLQELYNSEINFALSTFWDGGFDWKLGDEMNGFKAEGSNDSLEDAELSLAMEAVKHYPKSEFSLWFYEQVDGIRQALKDAAKATRLKVKDA